MSDRESDENENASTASNINTFVKNVIDGEYAQANNDLAKTINDKIKDKIRQVQTSNPTIFKNDNE
jgi:hypothetical protein|tara:strand:- start:7297 stop:7494 length:198 start_codon:yes stop_codon:yes gene_type:complete